MRPETDESLLDWLAAQFDGRIAFEDVLKRYPDMTPDDAYRVRAALVRRRLDAGDSLLGYKVAGASLAVRADEAVDGAIVGSMLKSCLVSKYETVRIGGFAKVFAEAEVAVLLKRDLAGPRVTLADVFYATEGIFPAIEVVASHTTAKLSNPARIVGNKFSGSIVLGDKLSSLESLDLRLEGVVATHNDSVKGSATGVEVFGHPLNAVVYMANTMAHYGETLRAGMILMTGSFLPGIPLQPGDRVCMEFTRLGSVGAIFDT